MGDLHVEDTHNFILPNGVITHNSGKTLAGIVEDVYWCLRHAGIVGYVFEPNFPMIERNVVPHLNRLLGIPFWESPLVDDFNRTRMNMRWYNGSVLWFISLDRPEGAEGGNIDFAHVDEARLVSPEANWVTAWKVIQRRLRGSGLGDFPIGAWVTTTPNRPGSALHRFFEDPKTRNPGAQVYRMHLDDNAEHLPVGYIEDIKREHSDSLYKRFVEGLFAGEETVTFAFDYAIHVQGFEAGFRRMKYVYPPATVEERKERGKRSWFGEVAYGADFGWTDETAVVAVVFDNDRRAFILDEVYEKRMSNADIADKCEELRDKWGDGTFWCDPRAPDTIDYLRKEGIRAKPGNSRRDEGIREIGGRFKDAGDGWHRLYVLDRCINTIDELQTYNEDQKGHDHAVDALRYCLMGGKRRRDSAWGFGNRERGRLWPR
jgi:hypothetical protein